MIPESNPRSETDYTIVDDTDECTVFTATGKKFGDRPGREFRDSSGLPLYELHQKLVPLSQPWTISLPGCDDSGLVSTQLRPNLRGYRCVSCEIKFQNAAAIPNKHVHEKIVKLHTQRRPSRLYAFDVMDGDRKVAEVQESISKNEKLALMPEHRKGYHPILDIRVAPGVDLALVSHVSTEGKHADADLGHPHCRYSVGLDVCISLVATISVNLCPACLFAFHSIQRRHDQILHVAFVVNALPTSHIIVMTSMYHPFNPTPPEQHSRRTSFPTLTSILVPQ